jgi:hypothetical protein
MAVITLTINSIFSAVFTDEVRTKNNVDYYVLIKEFKGYSIIHL